MRKINENIVFLNWTLPLISFFFFLISVKFSVSYHSGLLFKVFILCLGFSSLVSFVYRKSLFIGEALFCGILSIIFFGLMPIFIQGILGLIVVSFLFIEIKYLIQTLDRKKLLTFFIAYIAILLSFIPYFNFEYSQPNAMYKLINSGLHNDTLYHVAMASMWKGYQSISHGLHGLGALEYHYGSHLLMAGASSLLQISSFESYSHFFGFFCMPLLGISALSMIEEYFPSEDNLDFYKKLSTYLFILVGTGVLKIGGFFYRFALWPSFYESESYILSLILLFSFYSVIKAENFFSKPFKSFFIVSILALMSLSKISTGFCALAVLGSWALVSREKLFSKSWILRWILFFISCIAFLLILISINPSKGDAYLQPFQFVNTYVDFKTVLWVKYISFVFVHFSFVLVAFFFYYFAFKNEEIRNAFPLWWFLGTFISFSVGLGVLTFLNIMGGSGYYFANVSMFMAIPILVCIPRILKAKLNKVFSLLLLIGLLIISFYNAPGLLFDGFKSFVVQIKQIPQPNPFSVYIDKLNIVRNDLTSKRALVYIPHSENIYWKEPVNGEKVDPTCRSAGYIIPAISERPAIFGWPSNECYEFLCGPRFHSNGLCDKSKKNFTDSELLSEAKQLGFDRVDIITESGIRILQ